MPGGGAACCLGPGREWAKDTTVHVSPPQVWLDDLWLDLRGFSFIAGANVSDALAIIPQDKSSVVLASQDIW